MSAGTVSKPNTSGLINTANPTKAVVTYAINQKIFLSAHFVCLKAVFVVDPTSIRRASSLISLYKSSLFFVFWGWMNRLYLRNKCATVIDGRWSSRCY